MRKYIVIIEKSNEGYVACAPDFDVCISAGDTIEEAKANYYKALSFHLKGLIEKNYDIPIPKITYKEALKIKETEAGEIYTIELPDKIKEIGVVDCRLFIANPDNFKKYFPYKYEKVKKYLSIKENFDYYSPSNLEELSQFLLKLDKHIKIPLPESFEDVEVNDETNQKIEKSWEKTKERVKAIEEEGIDNVVLFHKIGKVVKKSDMVIIDELAAGSEISSKLKNYPIKEYYLTCKKIDDNNVSVELSTTKGSFINKRIILGNGDQIIFDQNVTVPKTILLKKFDYNKLNLDEPFWVEDISLL